MHTAFFKQAISIGLFSPPLAGGNKPILHQTGKRRSLFVED
jgi:hypothetical protein